MIIILRKINAVISLLTTLMLLDHAVFHGVWMLSGCKIAKSANSMAKILFILMMLHAFISIILAILGHKGAEKRKCNGYSNLNKLTYVQRTSGLLLIVLTILHILGTVGVMQPPKLVHAILPPLFFAITLMHTAISTNKAFITLGVGNAKTIKVIDILVKVICVLTLIVDVVGFYLYVC